MKVTQTSELVLRPLFCLQATQGNIGRDVCLASLEHISQFSRTNQQIQSVNKAKIMKRKHQVFIGDVSEAPVSHGHWIHQSIFVLSGIGSVCTLESDMTLASNSGPSDFNFSHMNSTIHESADRWARFIHLFTRKLKIRFDRTGVALSSHHHFCMLSSRYIVILALRNFIFYLFVKIQVLIN